MNGAAQTLMQVPWPLLSVAAGLILLLAWRGALRSDVFRDAPDRGIGLGAIDLVAGIGLILLGMLLMQALAPWLLGDVASLDDASPQRTVVIVLAGQLLLQLPPAAYLLIRAAGVARGLHRIGLAPRRPIREGLVAILAFAVAIPIVLALLAIGAAWATLLGRPPSAIAHRLLETFVEPDVPVAVLIALGVTVIVLGPLLEELVYRGLAQSATVESLAGRRWLAIVTVSIAFAFMHLGAAAWHTLPALFAFSVILGWVYERTGSLLPCVVIHALFNAFNVSVALALARQ